jgi:titin
VGNGDGLLLSFSSNNVIGGTTAALRNLIAGNRGSGIHLTSDVLTRGNLIEGNYIGTDITGTKSLGNKTGVELDEANNMVGGTAAGDGNLISGNDVGIAISSSGMILQGNLIGTDVTGTVALSNRIGVAIESYPAQQVLIGGTTAAARNLISGNGDYGVALVGPNNLVQGNFIGTDVTGTLAVSNGSFGTGGVFIGASNNVIGETAPGAGNVISGNSSYGVLINTSTGNLVQGNFIGTDVSGTQPLGNGGIGVFLGAVSNNTIGGTAAGAGNLISANQLDGIGITGNNNLVQGNYIGTDVTGLVPLGNGETGLFVESASGNTIGGTAPGARNLVSGNLSDGIQLQGSGTNVVQGNRIGTDVTGTAALPNGGSGVSVFNGFLQASGNTIGGTVAGAANIIAFNDSDGVRVSGGTRNAILRNVIFGHDAGLGIDLVNNGNNNQAFPVLTSASSDGSSTTIIGGLASTPSTTFTVEFFADTVSNPSGYGEGRRFLGSTTVTTDAAGNADFTFTMAIAVHPGQFIAATATDPANNTSAFSACIQVVDAGTSGVVVGPLGASKDDGIFRSLAGGNFAPGTEFSLPVLPSPLAIESNIAWSEPVAPKRVVPPAEGDRFFCDFYLDLDGTSPLLPSPVENTVLQWT